MNLSGSHKTTVRTSVGMPVSGGVLLGIGCAPGGLHDAFRFVRQEPDARACAVNDAIFEWPGRLEIAASSHAGYMREQTPFGRSKPWLALRESKGLPAPEFVVATRGAMGVNVILENQCKLGSSAMLIVLLGRLLRCERIVLAGVCMGGSYHKPFFHLWQKAHAEGLLDTVRCLTPGPLQELVGRAEA